MSSISTKELQSNHHQIQIQIPYKELKDSFDKSVKEQAKNADIAGFRKGMAPAGLIKKMKGDAILTHTLFHKAEHEIGDYIKGKNLEIIGQPLMVGFPERIAYADTDAVYEFTFEIGTKPTFALADITKCKAQKYKVSVTDQMAEEEIAMLRRKFGKLEEVQEIKSVEDIVYVEFAPYEAAPTEDASSRKGNTLLVKYFKNPSSLSLLGKKPNEEIVSTLEEAFEEKELGWILKDLDLENTEENRRKKYRIILTKISHIKPAFIDEDFLKKAYPYSDLKNEAELSEKIKADLNFMWDRKTKNYTYNEIYLYWIKHTDIKLPVDFLQKWYTQREGYQKPTSEQEEKKQLSSFLSQLKWTLILDAVSSAQKFDISREDIIQHIKKEVDLYYPQYDAAQKNGIVSQLINNADHIYNTRERLLNERVFEWADAQINVEEKSVSAETFLEENEKSELSLADV